MASIQPFINRKIVVLHQDSTVDQAARAMCENQVGCVVVSDHEGHIVGIATDRDLTCNILATGFDAGMELQEAMTDRPIFVDENADTEDVIRLMTENGIRRIPVVHQTEKNTERCVGLITLDDLIASRTIDPERLSRIVQSQIFRRRAFGVRARAQGHKRKERAEARRQQTLDRFHKRIAERADIGQDRVPNISKIILGSVVQRLHYTGAAHMIAQLPSLLQDELLDLPAGPDRSITVDRIVERISNEYNFDRDMARQVLGAFWLALEELVDPKELQHVRDQLPDDFKSAFVSSELEAGGDNVAA